MESMTVMDADRITDLTPIRSIVLADKDKANPAVSSSSSSPVFFSTTCNHLSAKYFWNISGSKLEVFSFESRCRNRLVALFDFSEIFQEQNMVITNVVRLADRFEMVAARYRHPHHLVVIIQLIDSRNLICIVDIRLNNLVHYIDFPFNIATAEVILSGLKENVPNMPLIDELCHLNGILAVGCDGGLVFFLDLILDTYSPDPMIPKRVSMVSHNSAHMDIEKKRRSAIFHNQVICIPLNADAKNKDKFHYRTDDGMIMESFLASQVYVSALHYIPQISLLCVGFNFGGFQLYNLKTFSLDCNCALDSDLLPVVSFAFQAPENDPKNFSYLWTVRGFKQRMSNIEESSVDSYSTAFIYLLCYKNKQLVENYGILYDTFKMCCCKFELPLTYGYEQNEIKLDGISKLIDMFTIQQIVPFDKFPDDDDVLGSPIDYNYLFIGWENIGDRKTTRRNNPGDHYFCIFDLNQWYKSQMPKSYMVDADGHCPFISVYSLNSAAKLFSSNSVQAVYLANNSLTKFHSDLFYADIHSYPGSLSLTMTVVASDATKLCNVAYLGLQKRLLAQLTAVTNVKMFAGDCQDFITKCFKCGLIAGEHLSLMSSGDHPVPADTKSNLFMLINIALENNLNCFLTNFIRQLCQEDSIYTGTDLKMVVDWIWDKVEAIKGSIDLLTESLFDTVPGFNVSRQDISRLVCHESKLRTLSMLLRRILENSVAITNLNFDKLKARIEVIDLMLDYLKFVLIFENLDLLPELKPETGHDDQSDTSDQTGPLYYSEKLASFYRKRRQDFLALDPNLFQQNSILLIDVIVHQFKDQLLTVWKTPDDDDGQQREDNGDKPLYPPANLSSLLKIFLLDSMPKIYKQTILLYFIYDIGEYLQNPNIAQKFLTFLSLNVSHGITKFIKGLWFLDHQQHESALQAFTHPLVTESMIEFKSDMALFNQLMARIIEMFLFENHFHRAMMFVTTCNHVRLDQEQNENLYIQILLLNGNLDGAFEYQRQRRSEATTYNLLYKIFFICEKMNILVQTCRLLMDSYEEKVFVDYLLGSANVKARMILALYFVLNNKIVEAIKVAEQYEHEFLANEENREVLDLIKAYVTVLPTASLELAEKIFNIANRNESNRLREYSPPADHQKQEPESRVEQTPISRMFQMRHNGDRQQSTNKRSLYLSPGLSSSKIVKWKHKSQFRKLFDILKTPDIKRETRRAMFPPADSAVATKPILKVQPSSSSQHNDSHNKLKVSFSKEKISMDVSDCESTDGSQNQDGFVTPVKKIHGRKAAAAVAADSPSHRMILRSNKKM